MNKKQPGSIRTRILKYSLLLALVPITVISAISFYASFQVVMNLAIDAVENQVERVHAQMESVTSGIERFGWMVANDSAMQAALRQPLPESATERYSQSMNMNFTLIFIKEYQEDVHSFSVIGENGAVFKSDMISELDENFQQLSWYRDVVSSDKPIWFEPHSGSYILHSVGQSMISVGFPITDKLTGSKLGVVVVEIEAQRFVEMCGTQLMRNGKLLLVNELNELLIYPEMDVGIGTVSQGQREESMATANLSESLLHHIDLPDIPFTGRVSNEQGAYLITSSPTSVGNWKLVGIMPYSTLLQDSLSIAAIIGATMAVVCVLVILVAGYATEKIVRPLKTVSNSMKLVEQGDFSTRVEIKSDDEVGRLSYSFNSMLDEVNVLMEKERSDQKKLRIAEYRALQAQINPHFLYNTLDSISWLARAERMNGVCEMVDALTNFFRSGLSKGRDFITLREELCHVESYLFIQKIRYESKLEYTIDVPEQLQSCMIAKLVLQPLVENSIYHGIKFKKEKGLITIGGIEEGDDILLWVSDTGIGMPDEKLVALNDAIQNDKNTTEVNSYGIVNVQKRIVIYFGARYGLRYESTYGQGTTAYLRIPKKLEM